MPISGLKIVVAGAISSAFILLPQQAMACRWWDWPCKAEEAWNEIERGVEHAKRVADEALNVAAQRLEQETEILAEEAESFTVDEAKRLARGVTAAYSAGINEAKKGYDAARKAVEAELAKLEQALLKKIVREVTGTTAPVRDTVVKVARELDSDGLNMLKRLQKDLLTNHITTQTVSDYQGLLLKLGLAHASPSLAPSIRASAMAHTRVSAVAHAGGAAPPSYRAFLLSRYPALQHSQAQRQMGLGPIVSVRTPMRIRSAAAFRGAAAEPASATPAEQTEGFGPGHIFRGVALSAEVAYADIVGGSLGIGIMAGANEEDEAVVAIAITAKAIVGAAELAGPPPFSLSFFKELPNSALKNPLFSVNAAGFGFDWDIPISNAGLKWLALAPNPSFLLPFSVSPSAAPSDFAIGAGNSFVVILKNLPPRFDPPPQDEVVMADQPLCNLKPEGVMLNTNSKINGEIYRLTTGWHVGDNADASRGWTGVGNLLAAERTIYPSIWGIQPAGDCSYFLVNSWLHGYLTAIGDSVYHVSNPTPYSRWKFYPNNGSIGGYRIVLAADKRELHTGYDGTNFGPPRMAPYGAGGLRDAIWILNRTFNPPS